ncbi:Thylakoid lumenal protein [Monoraphidium neglectum]|uniref:Thylakoid lumenal protein n=1 Tax=Monoraphidium neglectum TaxID=145388 RepID=A0A0D2ITV5_9CHLO|nr:Thylakoid lumenal protein [Monoraphidium neglectum]KIY91442.1 Thylakoid lumenal protein [Monoraphidium neglectum]|eukprot:XP_013890462.1 Thylakoid lumenal protein [Monoraphidium neglectum]
MAPYMHLNQKSLASRSNRSGCGPAARRAAAVVPPSATSRPSHEQLVQNLQRAGLAALASVLVAVAPPSAMADLNRFEADAGGEFGRGSAGQYGEADLQGKDFSGQDLRRSNFTSADCRKANFSGAKLQGAYFMKAVAFRTNFEGANLSDVLMDR